MDVAVDFCMETDETSCGGFEDCVPRRFADIASAVAVDLSDGSDGVEGESVWSNANNRTLLCVSVGVQP
jgi:hypothetical protein